MKSKHPFGRSRSSPPPAKATLHPADWVVESDAVDDVLREMSGQLGRRRRRRLRAMVSGLVVLLFASLVWRRPNQPTSATERITPHSAVVSLPERRMLTDGSIVELRN